MNLAAARRLVVAVLLRACLDSLRNADAREWLESEQACNWAQLADFERWPPKPGQLGTRRDLVKRARG